MAWRGTVLPKTDGDIWLATAFADYQQMVSLAKTRIKKGEAAAEASVDLGLLGTAVSEGPLALASPLFR